MKPEISMSREIKIFPTERLNRYTAHTAVSLESETLLEHINLVYEYAQLLYKEQNLAPVLKNIHNVLGIKISLEEFEFLFFKSIYDHDMGKLNENFQYYRMNNKNFQPVKSVWENEHSYLSGLLFLLFVIDQIINDKHNEESQNEIVKLSLWFTYSLFKHHSSTMYDFWGELQNKLEKQIDGESLARYYKILYNRDVASKIPVLQQLIQNITNDINGLNERFLQAPEDTEGKGVGYARIFLHKLHFSILTKADYLATTHYQWNLQKDKLTDVGVINKETREKFTANFKSIHYNQSLYEENGKTSGEGLNQLREEIARAVKTNIENNIDKKLFYIEAPTGAGKTNLSLLTTSVLLENNEDIKKVFYVFPFTSIATQTTAILRAAPEEGGVGLNETEIIEYHSKAGFPEKKQEDVVDGYYGKDKFNYLQYLFINFPFVAISHVGFFDIVNGITKEKNYSFYALANSLVIIDELQAYNPKIWDRLAYMMKYLSDILNVRFVVMSATLPKIDQLVQRLESMQGFNSFTTLLDKPQKYFKEDSLFVKRVKFEELPIDDFKEEGEFSNTILAKSVLTKSIERKHKDQGVRTIIEFLTKKRASEFFAEVEKQNTNKKVFDRVFLLSGTILDFRRREIIQTIKNRPDLSILLVTTQVVEAGVDIDMDIGFKDRSIIDSEEQLAGRINRNARKKDSVLYLFSSGDGDFIYKKDKRYEVQKNHGIDVLDVLRTKAFDNYYGKVIEQINKWNASPLTINIETHNSFFRRGEFVKIKKDFEIIEDNDSISVFVPVNIPITTKVIMADGKEEKIQNFSEKDIEFLQKYQGPIANDRVIGVKVFEIFENIIQNKPDDFTEKKLQFKIITSILARFTFSIIWSYSTREALKAAGSEKYGYFHLNPDKIGEKGLYSIEGGLMLKANKENQKESFEII